MRHVHFSEQQRQRMKQMYESDDCSIAKIAMNFGVSVPTITSHLREMGVKIKGRGRRPSKKVTTVVDEPVITGVEQPSPFQTVKYVPVFDV